MARTLREITSAHRYAPWEVISDPKAPYFGVEGALLSFLSEVWWIYLLHAQRFRGLGVKAAAGIEASTVDRLCHTVTLDQF
jgi:hypothetical protein